MKESPTNLLRFLIFGVLHLGNTDQVIACCLLGAKPLTESMLTYCQQDPKEYIQPNFDWNSEVFIHEKSFKILAKGQKTCSDLSTCSLSDYLPLSPGRPHIGYACVQGRGWPQLRRSGPLSRRRRRVVRDGNGGPLRSWGQEWSRVSLVFGTRRSYTR